VLREDVAGHAKCETGATLPRPGTMRQHFEFYFRWLDPMNQASGVCHRLTSICEERYFLFSRLYSVSPISPLTLHRGTEAAPLNCFRTSQCRWIFHTKYFFSGHLSSLVFYTFTGMFIYKFNPFSHLIGWLQANTAAP
jgi:hypothetical protein